MNQTKSKRGVPMGDYRDCGGFFGGGWEWIIIIILIILIFFPGIFGGSDKCKDCC